MAMASADEDSSSDESGFAGSPKAISQQPLLSPGRRRASSGKSRSRSLVPVVDWCSHHDEDLNDENVSSENWNDPSLTILGSCCFRFCLFWGQKVKFCTPYNHESIIEQNHQDSYYPIRQINNVGNTCYLNAIIQCLNQTTGVHDKIFGSSPREYNVNSEHISTVTVSSYDGPISKELINLFDEMKTTPRVTPRSLLDKIIQEQNAFQVGTQQDSQEVLRLILDKLKTEEIQNIQEKIRVQCNASITEESMDGILQSATKFITPVEEVFGGKLVNTIICRECLTPLQKVEDFFDLQLSIPEPNQQERRSPLSSTIKPPKHANTDRETPISINSSEAELSDTEQNDDSQWFCNNVISSQLMVASNKVDPKSFTSLQSYLKDKGLENCSTDIADLKPTNGVEKSLKEFIAIDVLNEENKFMCDTCWAKKPSAYNGSLVNKQMLITQLPLVLVLHIKRFVIGRHSVFKNDQHLSFPHTLDMAPYCTDKCLEELKDKHGHTYGLYSVVVHNGRTLRGGHYVAYVKRRRKMQQTSSGASNTEFDQKETDDNTWYRTDDQRIKKCSRGYYDVCKKKAYLLFYELLQK